MRNIQKTFQITFMMIVIGISFAVISYLVVRNSKDQELRLMCQEMCNSARPTTRYGIAEVVQYNRDGSAFALCTDGESKWVIEVK